jgi:hypothetical protein
VNLYASNPGQVAELVKIIETHKANIGPLPRRLKNRIGGDNSHNKYLREKYGEQ